jgi:hypothetical protein
MHAISEESTSAGGRRAALSAQPPMTIGKKNARKGITTRVYIIDGWRKALG